MTRLKEILLWLTAACAFAGSLPAWGATSVLAGMFDGSEPAIARVPGGLSSTPATLCPGSIMPFHVSQFTVTVSGAYVAYSGLPVWADAPALTVAIYRGTFQPELPLANQVEFRHEGSSASTAPEAQLVSGQTYQLVVQQVCERREGAWAVALVGPGTAQSDDSVPVPSFTHGRFSDSDPQMTAPAGCSGEGMLRYKVIGPIQVSRSGSYFFQSPNYTRPVGALCFSVHTAPPPGENQEENLVGRAFLAGEIDLEAGRNYWLYVLSGSVLTPREYSFVLAPPAPFRINKGLADAWYNPDMPGQGIFLDVYEDRNSLFLGWFTYVLEGEPSDEMRHRWLTAFGPFQGSRSRLDLEWTAADHPRPEGQPPSQHIDGHLDVEFHDCHSGLIRYAWGASDSGTALVEGEMPIRRIANDGVALCESLYEGPGMPGRL